MASKLKRMTFVLTPEMEPLLDGIKKEMFYNCSQSEMIRTLVDAGLNARMKDRVTQQNNLYKHTREVVQYAVGTLFRKGSF